MCKLYIVRPGGAERLGPAAGGAAYAFGRERRWPSFIIWRWAGPALGGWTRCRWRIRRVRVPHRHLPTTTSASPQGEAAADQPARGRRPPESRPAQQNPRKNRPGAAPRRQRSAEPRRAPENRPRSPVERLRAGLPGRAPSGRVEGARAARPRGGSPRAERPLAVRHLGRQPRKGAAAGGVSSGRTVPCRSGRGRPHS
jgi:hypothetical protein